LASQIAYLVLIILAVGVILAYTKEKSKNILALAIFITPWQGGLWIKGLDLDLLASNLLYFGLFFYLLINNRRSPNKLYMPLFLAFLGMFIGAVISSIGALNLPKARGGAFMILERYIIFFCMFNMIKRPKDLKFILYPIVFSLLFQSVLGILQFRFNYLKLGVIDGGRSFQRWRGAGTLFHANAFGMYFVLTLPIILRLLFVALRFGRKKRMYLYLAALILGAGGLFVSQSRGAWIGFGFGLTVMFLIGLVRNRDRLRKYFVKLSPVIVIFGVIFLIKYGNLFFSRLSGSYFSSSYEYRLELEQKSYEMIQQHPTFGVGWGNYKEHGNFEFVHNLYLLILSELGYVGFFFYILIMLIWLWQLWKGLKTGNLFVSNLILGCIASFAGFIVASIPGPDYLIARQFGSCVWLIIGLTFTLVRINRTYHSRRFSYYFKKNGIDKKSQEKIISDLKNQWTSNI